MKNFDNIKSRESGLKQALSEQQMSMLAIGGAIGTGLFAGSKIVIGFAGPSVLLSYLIAGFIALLFMGSLAEMTVHHPTSGSFGSYAEHYLGKGLGFFTRYCYLGGVILAIGAEIAAVGDYMKFWYPDVPTYLWQIMFSVILIGANLISVKAFGSIEYLFSVTKLFVISAFLIVGIGSLFLHSDAQTVQRNLLGSDAGGFFPNGLRGMWFGVVMGMFSYFGIEFIAVAAGEAKDPQHTIKKAFKSTLFRLLFFYLATLTVIIMLTPWQELLDKNAASPFVKVMQSIDIPFASGIINAVVIIASLSAMNGMLYITSRMLFSLSRAGDAPARLGKVARNGVPINALMVSVLGIAVSLVVSTIKPDLALPIMMAITTFGLLMTWVMVFITHLAFRKHIRRTQEKLAFRTFGHPVGPVLGIIGIGAILVSTWFEPALHVTLQFGLLYVLIVAAAWFICSRRKARQACNEVPEIESKDKTSHPQR